MEWELLQSLLFELQTTSPTGMLRLHSLLEEEGGKKDGQELVLSPEHK